MVMTKRLITSNLNPMAYIIGFCCVFSVLWLVALVLEAFLPLLKVGIPLAVIWWVWRHHQVVQQRRQDVVDSAFYKILRERSGYVTVLDFAIATKLPAAVARRQLDERAKEFSAQFGVTETGEVFYIFPVLRSPPPDFLNSNPQSSMP
jgi:hypothetical protein